MNGRVIFFLAAAAALFTLNTVFARPAGRFGFEEDEMKIRIIAGGAVLNATLENNAASRDFANLLPLELTLSDYNRTEKIADLPSRLSTDGSPDGVDPDVGDITYYAPWGNLALFHRDFGYSRGLIRLGRIEGDLGPLAGNGPIDARIERVAAQK